MKIRKSAIIESLSVNGEPISVPENMNIDLEFSALDTGGRFEDPMLDFSLTLENRSLNIPSNDAEQAECEITISDPLNREKSCTIKNQCQIAGNDQIEINGRITEENLENDVIGFVINLKG